MKPITLIIALAACLSAQTPADRGTQAGKALPAFQLPDQDGKQQTLESLRGPKGLLLVFVRSADW